MFERAGRGSRCPKRSGSSWLRTGGAQGAPLSTHRSRQRMARASCCCNSATGAWWRLWASRSATPRPQAASPSTASQPAFLRRRAPHAPALVHLAPPSYMGAVTRQACSPLTRRRVLQVGCPMRCTFCATGKGGFARNLRTHEIIDQARLPCPALSFPVERMTSLQYAQRNDDFGCMGAIRFWPSRSALANASATWVRSQRTL